MHGKRTMQSVVASERWAGCFSEVCFCCINTTLPTNCICLERWEMHLFTFSVHFQFLLKWSVLSTFTNRTSVSYPALLHIFSLFTQLSSIPLISFHPSFAFYLAFSLKQCEDFAWQMILSVQVFAPPWWVFKHGADICLQKNSDLLGESSLSNLLGLFLPLNDIFVSLMLKGSDTLQKAAADLAHKSKWCFFQMLKVVIIW